MRPPPIRTSFICSRCRFLRSYTTNTNTTTSPLQSPSLPPPPPTSGTALLTNRRLLAIHGHDSAHFLHGITTSNIQSSSSSSQTQPTGLYSAFLNAQGRVLNDVFIYPAAHSPAYHASLPEKLKQTHGADAGATPALFVEVDAQEVDKLVKHLKKYKLRAKVDIRVVDEGEWNIWSIWNESEPWTPHPAQPTEYSNESTTTASVSAAAAAAQESKSETNDTIGCVDARAPGMGRRLILPAHTSPTDSIPHAGLQTDLAAYTIRRILRGVPEGQDEIPREAALPQEYNIDFMGGIDFRKGCYVGQELTIRTHHTGVVRKRVLPVMLYTAGERPPDRLEYDPRRNLVQNGDPGPLATGANIMPAAGKRGRSAGKWITGIGNVGLGLCRLEMMTDMVLTAEGGGSRWTEEDEFKVVKNSSSSGVTVGEETGKEGGRASVEDEVSPGSDSEVRIKAFVPDWHRSKTKIRKSQVRV